MHQAYRQDEMGTPLQCFESGYERENDCFSVQHLLIHEQNERPDSLYRGVSVLLLLGRNMYERSAGNVSLLLEDMGDSTDESADKRECILASIGYKTSLSS